MIDSRGATPVTDRPTILELSDAGHHPDAISRTLGISTASVYTVLRAERPNRPRKPRPRTSDLPYRIRGLRSGGIKPGRIAELLRCSRTFVYRVLVTTESLPPPPY